ncbi:MULTISPECIES: long-chain fatty acid--CoA ligase [Halopseudomonas]|uniref:Long-chain fatty acid--CoA ligase n=1 Tax=Halopseudomonas bauzanensis TaxID=653930 RepID=A0A4U0YQJ8_9GAMM|nr:MULTISPECIES: long-chain fatty acid--CoA ligase [Halopseudomonas]TKA92536.1 long-chain fatty acid--CoA ligase [Halopseudomonas bauzanensis]WGK62794.1 long-chain fatty acid--CoA ligase [Halopseudomonas sp. SMJS2]
MFTHHYAVWPKHLPKSLPLPETSLVTNLEISARRYPARPAIIFYDTTISYAELLSEVESLAGWLQKKGLKKGDRALLYMQNSPQYVIGYYAILRCDGIVVPVNPMNRTTELEHYASDTGAEFCLAGYELMSHVSPLLGKTSLKHIVVSAYGTRLRAPTDLELPEEVATSPGRFDEGCTNWDEALQSGHKPTPYTAGPDDLALIPYSSGTTGAPKGCMHTHRSVMTTTVQRVVWNSATVNSVQLATLPFFHVTGMQASMNGPIYIGGTSVIMTRWNRTVAAQLIERYHVTGWANIVTMAVDFLLNPELDRYDVSSLTHIGGGGAAMPEAVAAKLYRLTGLHYIEGYGLSETIAATHTNPPDAPKPQCLGIPMFDVDSRIINPDTLELLGPGEVGEIISHGPQVAQGYWNRPDETAAAFIELEGKRFFRTGDLARYDDNGYFYMVDRIKRMINASGFKVWPSEVESMMYQNPLVQEVCIISSPDTKRGETVKACVVLSADADPQTAEQEISSWCKSNMAAYKTPQVFEFVSALPKSSSGKIMWRELQEQEHRKIGH